MQGMELLGLGTGTVGGAASVGAVAWWFFRTLSERFLRQHDALATEVARLKTEQIVEIRHDIAEIRKNCKADLNTANLAAMQMCLARIEGKVDQFTADVASLKTAEARTHGFVSDVSRELRAHVSTHPREG